MSKYENFNNLVANHLETASTSLAMDICYLFGLMDGRAHDEDVSLDEIDNAYGFKGIHVVIGNREKEYVMYVVRDDGGDNVVLIRISKLFEKYQIANAFSDLYLQFYLNTNVEEVNAFMAR